MLSTGVLICATVLAQVFHSNSELVHHSSFHKRDTSVIDKGTHLLICEQNPLELGIVFDSSRSIPRRDFATGLQFLQDFLDQYDIGSGRNNVRVSMITFGRGIYDQDSFDLTTYDNKEDLITAVGVVPFRSGDYTDTGEAIQHMHQVQFAEDIVRPGVPRVSIVFTDGNSQRWSVTKAAAQAARDDGIIMFAVGIGRSVRDTELLNIAGDPSRITKVDNYNKLQEITAMLAYKTCIKKEKPTTTTPPPQMQSCGEENPADVYFVFSPKTMGPDSTAWTTSFISHTLSSEDMDVGFRYGVLSGDCPDDAGFNLARYNNVDDIKERLLRYDNLQMPTLNEDAFSPENGGRAEARDVVVLVASGAKNQGEDLDRQVELLRRLQPEPQIFIADPSGQGVHLPGTTPLSGQSSRLQAENLITWLCPA